MSLSQSFLACCLLAFAVDAPPGQAAPWSGITASLRCRSAVEELLSRWGASGEILRAPAGLDGRAVYRLATGEIGVWVTVQMDPAEREAILFRTGSWERSVKVSLDDDCQPSTSEIAVSAPGLAEGGFGDGDLREALSRTPRLAVLLWSPHMPLSVDAYFELEAACRGLGVPLLALTDPSSDPGYLEKVGDERGIPPEARRPLASVELLFRDLAVHAPSVMVFWEGKVSAPLPGFRSRDAYRDFLEKAVRSP